ncbi:MAG: LmeA family phospholipid-binding protein [Anaerolineales bacterium]
MTGTIRLRQTGFVVLALVIASVACSLGGTAATATPRPTDIPVSTEAAGQLENVWATAVAGSHDGQVSVVMTEQQLTSYIAIKMAENPDAPFKDPQVRLRDGKMTLTANATFQGVKAPIEIILSAAPDSEGVLKVTIEEAKLGGLPMPAALRDSVSTSINELVIGQIGSEGTGVKITAVTIADGQMVLTGTLTK